MIRTVLLFGGKSPEHDVSILSARSVSGAAPASRIEIVPVCIAKDGFFCTVERSTKILAGEESSRNGDADFSFEVWARGAAIDIVFPLIHGVGGEDGTLQGYLEILGLPYVGSDTTASAVGMDKIHMKQAFFAARLPIVEYVAVDAHEWAHERERVTRSVANILRLPFFVKPANGGSSIGVTKVKKDAELPAALEHALLFDGRVLIERGIDARELEVSVLGNDEPVASVPGEIVAGAEFYDYSDKYLDHSSRLVIPAKLSAAKATEIRSLAIEAFTLVGASGFSRVDFFLERGTNRLYLNEINTIPGFTSISMYPKLWEATELKYSRLIERLIELGLERSRSRAERQTKAMQWLDEMKPLT